MLTSMKLRKWTMPAALSLPVLALVLPAYAAQPVTGRWLTKEDKALVQIAPCGKMLCGQILKVIKPTPGRSSNDIKNPDEKLRNRPVEGLIILSDFTDGGSVWKGKIYDPESGKTYNSKLSRKDDGTLDVQGCVLFFCQAQTWTPTR